jgi:hypothetical protein
LFSKFPFETREALIPYLEDQEVWDLGCGLDLRQSIVLRNLGAKKVFAVDKELRSTVGGLGGVVSFPGYFQDLSEDISPKVAFLGWPSCYNNGLKALAARSETVIVLGQVDRFTMCGGPKLWRHLLTRELDCYQYHQRNSLMVYGKRLGQLRKCTCPEESAAASSYNIY